MPMMMCLLENRENRENNLIWYRCIDLGLPVCEKTEKTEKTTLYDMGTFALGLPVCEKTEKTGKTRTFKDANNAVLLGLVSLHTNTVLC